jgi:hypothetical protein
MQESFTLYEITKLKKQKTNKSQMPMTKIPNRFDPPADTKADGQLIDLWCILVF